MEKAPIPSNEKKRLLSLYKLGLLDTKPEDRFDHITNTATKVFNVPISTLTLVDAKREWFKSCVGLPKKEGERAISFCGHALLANDVFVIEDTKKDKRFMDNPMVLGKPFIRFYAGVPIMSADQNRVGVFCIKDTKPRKFSKSDRDILKNLAAWAELEVNSRNLSLALAEQKKLQNKLIQQYNKAEKTRVKEEAILESVGDGLVAVDNERKIMIINKVASEMIGYKSKDLIGKVVTDFILEDEDGNLVPLSKRPTTIALATGKITRVRYFFVKKDKSRFPMEIVATPIRLNKKVIGLIEIIRDITHEHEIDKAKTEFISLASHQLKTPLTAIKLLTERLLSGKMEKLTAKQKEYFYDIKSSNERMIKLTNALLNVSRIELGAFSIYVEKKDVCDIVESVLYECRSILDEKHLKLKTVFPENRVTLEIDETLFRIIVNNLVANAINYTKDGGEISVESSVRQSGESIEGNLLKENSFLIKVSDTGYGIPEKEQSKIFTKLFRADNAKETHADGTGLGLYIVRSILEHSGGEIWFKSKENKGSVFCVAIPMTGMKAQVGKKGLIG